MNTICALLGCQYPIIQGAMSLASNPDLVAAVSQAGGFGVLASAPMREPDELRAEIRATRALTARPFGVNLAGFNPRTPDMARVVVDEGIKAVTGSAGFSAGVIGLLKEHGVRILQVVPNVALAQKAEAAGVDAIIAEGTESGGAQGDNGISTLVLVPLVADSVSLPVVAAGGIADRRGYLAARALGADAIQMGSRFLASQECHVHQNCKDAICAADERATTLIPLARFNARVLRCEAVTAYLKNPDAAALARLTATQSQVFHDGKLELGPLAVGQVAGMIRKVLPTGQIIEEIMVSDNAIA